VAKPGVCIIGGGMITQAQILPSFYQLQRLGLVGEIQVCALDSGPLRALAEDPGLRKAFPGHSFQAHPPLPTDPSHKNPDLFREVIARMGKGNIVVVAMPDPLHAMVLQEAIRHDQHICCVKPLVLRHGQAVEIERQAYEKGLVVGVEYHKRLDDRALLARRQYREGLFGEFKLGHAEMNEPYAYRHSNFMNWCTCENSDMFTYVGCHYVDQVHFITGLLPASLSVYGIVDSYPNGNQGYLWTSARVLWQNGACLNVINMMGYPDQGPGSNFQGLRMYCSAKDRSGMLVHNDQYRGIEYCYVEKMAPPDDKWYCEPSPDYLKFVDFGGGGLTPVGYGFRSIEYIVGNICRAIDASAGLPEAAAVAKRQELIRQYDQEGIMATPGNSSYNELVIEAGRLSLQSDGREVNIVYGPNAGVSIK
jgi:D-galacturonate reductase